MKPRFSSKALVWKASALGPDSPERRRTAHVAYLRKRLHAPPRPFVAAGKNAPFQFGR